MGNSIYVLQHAPTLKQFFKAAKNAFAGDLKWCNEVVCPADGGVLYNK